MAVKIVEMPALYHSTPRPMPSDKHNLMPLHTLPFMIGTNLQSS